MIVTNPVIVNEIKSRIGVVGYKIEPWLKTTKDDMFMIMLDDVLTISESSDIDMISMYQSFVRDSHADKTGQPKLSKRDGIYINSQ